MEKYITTNDLRINDVIYHEIGAQIREYNILSLVKGEDFIMIQTSEGRHYAFKVLLGKLISECGKYFLDKRCCITSVKNNLLKSIEYKKNEISKLTIEMQQCSESLSKLISQY